MAHQKTIEFQEFSLEIEYDYKPPYVTNDYDEEDDPYELHINEVTFINVNGIRTRVWEFIEDLQKALDITELENQLKEDHGH
jgi:hypothetical protein